MNRINTTINGKKQFFQAPSNWNELTKKQLITWCGIIRQTIDIDLAEKAVTALFYNIPYKLYTQFTDVQELQLRQTLDFLFKTNTLTANVIGNFYFLTKNYKGPNNKLANLTIAEYRRTELYYQLYTRTDDKFFLNLLAASLFKVKDVPETEKHIVRKAKLFRLLNPNLLHAILLFYEGCRAYIHKSFPRVFVKNKAADQPASQSNEIQDFEDIILAVAGDKFGNFKETQDANIYTFLKHLDQQLERSKKK